MNGILPNVNSRGSAQQAALVQSRHNNPNASRGQGSDHVNPALNERSARAQQAVRNANGGNTGEVVTPLPLNQVTRTIFQVTPENTRMAIPTPLVARIIGISRTTIRLQDSRRHETNWNVADLHNAVRQGTIQRDLQVEIRPNSRSYQMYIEDRQQSNIPLNQLTEFGDGILCRVYRT